jgi:ABC-2 type transport system permease protein
MSESVITPPPIIPAPRAPATEKTLRRLFLMLFLRGFSSRGLQRQGAPKSVFKKLWVILVIYALIGLVALAFMHQPVFALSVYLHAMTFVFLGMYVAASAGEILFNKNEGEILLHRPVTPRQLLWAKIAVLVEVSLWLAGAFNAVGLVAGLATGNGSWLFPVVHALSMAMEALFCTACIVLVYQLCLRWFGRERMEGLMTTAQVLLSIAAVVSGQIVPRVMFRFREVATLGVKTWWICLLPPAWFAGIDDAMAGAGTGGAWILAGLAIVATTLAVWLAFGKLAADYGTGLQVMSETVSPARKHGGQRRWIDSLVNKPPLSWWLREPVERAAFLLTSAYLVRDRDVKLRLYPGLAPMLIMPVIFLLQGRGRAGGGGGGFTFAFASGFLGIIPLMGLQLLQYSQQWQASDIFRSAPMSGPAPLCHGARKAVLLFLTLPMILLFGAILWVIGADRSQIYLTIPGLIALPVFSLIPGLVGAVPLSMPTEQAKSAGRGVTMMAVMFVSVSLSGLAAFLWNVGGFGWFIGIEAACALALYVCLHLRLKAARWQSME